MSIDRLVWWLVCGAFFNKIYSYMVDFVTFGGKGVQLVTFEFVEQC